MSKKKILIIEDEKTICRELTELLTNEGYEAEYLEQFDNAKNDILEKNSDLLLLDINIPGINGEMLLREIRKTSDVPIIMVTSRTGETDEVLSMSYGADDYITKPYNPTILLLRIAAILKRADSGKNIANYKDAQVNFSKGTISLNFSLITDLWDNNEFVNDNALTVNISRLRGKLTEIGYKDAIETRKKQGYCLT